MKNQIKFTYGGKEYTLEYTRETVMRIEKQGFRLDDLDKMPMTAITTLFAGAFMANHRNGMKMEKVEEIYKHMPNKQELLGKLVEMYLDPVQTLFDEPDENDEGNVNWTANW